MPSLNRVQIIGNVGADPELRYAPSGDAVTSFSVAVNRRWGDADDRKEDTTWFRCDAWNKVAEVVNQYVKKGDPIYVEGNVSLDQWEPKDGKAGGAALKLHVSSVQLLGSHQEPEPEAKPVQRPLVVPKPTPRSVPFSRAGAPAKSPIRR